MADEKDAFYVVRKGDISGIYKSFADCQAQAGFSPLDPSISVYKGYGLTKEAESYLSCHGLQQAEFSICASDVQDGLFGALSVCPFQDTVGCSSSRNPEKKPVMLKDNEEKPQVPIVAARVDSVFYSSSPIRQKQVDFKNDIHQVYPAHDTVRCSSSRNSQNKSVNLKNHEEKPTVPIVAARVDSVFYKHEIYPAQKSCTIEFDGASKGNPGLAGAGAVLRAVDASEVLRVREGVGIATNNVAEYRAVILGLRTAFQKGYKHVHVRGDSQLVIYQIQGRWRTKNENMVILCKEAKELIDKFESFAIEHVAREFNSDADAQANRGINLRVGQVEIDVARYHP